MGLREYACTVHQVRRIIIFQYLSLHKFGFILFLTGRHTQQHVMNPLFVDINNTRGRWSPQTATLSTASTHLDDRQAALTRQLCWNAQSFGSSQKHLTLTPVTAHMFLDVCVIGGQTFYFQIFLFVIQNRAVAHALTCCMDYTTIHQQSKKETPKVKKNGQEYKTSKQRKCRDMLRGGGGRVSCVDGEHCLSVYLIITGDLYVQ